MARPAPRWTSTSSTDARRRTWHGLITSLGEIDLLGEIVAGGGYDSLVGHSVELDLFGRRRRCITLSELIRVKRAAGRPKDFEALAELEKILEVTSEPPKARS